jgi:hypothetical protein
MRSPNWASPLNSAPQPVPRCSAGRRYPTACKHKGKVSHVRVSRCGRAPGLVVVWGDMSIAARWFVIASSLSAGSLACCGAPSKDYCAGHKSSFQSDLYICTENPCGESACKAALASCSSHEVSLLNETQACVDALPPCAQDAGTYFSGVLGCSFTNPISGSCEAALAAASPKYGCLFGF